MRRPQCGRLCTDHYGSEIYFMYEYYTASAAPCAPALSAASAARSPASAARCNLQMGEVRPVLSPVLRAMRPLRSSVQRPAASSSPRLMQKIFPKSNLRNEFVPNVILGKNFNKNILLKNFLRFQ
jgi:hypothetical protein